MSAKLEILEQRLKDLLDEITNKTSSKELLQEYESVKTQIEETKKLLQENSKLLRD